MNRCVGHCISEKINLNKFVVEYKGEVTKHRECLLVKIDSNDVFIFPYGVVIIWGKLAISAVIELLDPYLINKLEIKQINVDEFEISQDESNLLVKKDIIYLKEDDEYVRLSLSHPISQSLKLSQIEDEIVSKTQVLTKIPTQLAENGKISLSKKEISKVRGELYLLKSRMNLNYALLDKPEFFWEWPEYDQYYQKLTEYLEFDQRVNILHKRMETIDELLSILVEELNHRHSSKLEWIIIWLILIEIIIFLGHDLFKLF